MDPSPSPLVPAPVASARSGASVRPVPTGRAELGRYGETLAARYLTDRGMVVIERNWRCRAGELDIVAVDRRVLVACEVKTRRSCDFGAPIEAVTATKLLRLRRLVGAWLQEHPDHGFAQVRIDVVGVLRPADGPARIEHLVGVA